MKLVLLGTPSAAVPSFHALLDAGHEAVLVVTQPDRPVGRSRNPQPPPMKQAAVERGVAVIQPTKVRNSAFREELERRSPDLLVVVAYGRILPGKVLRVAPLGAVNLHFSMLPAYRGAAPVQWALVRGERSTGVTTMQINERMDEGDILLQEAASILDGEHAPELEGRLADVGARLLVRTLSELERGAIVPRPQDHDRASTAPLLSRADGLIDLALTAEEISGRVRGFDPWPGAWLVHADKRLRLVEARVLDEKGHDEPPGTLSGDASDALVMSCAGGTRLLLLKIQPEGRRAMSVRDALNGRYLRAGDRLEGARERD